MWYNQPITTRPRPGTQKITAWQRPRRSSSPTINPTPPCLLNHVLKHGTTDPSLPSCNQGHVVQPTHRCPAETTDAENHRLEKASKVIKSNCQPNTTVPAKPCSQGPHPDGFWTPPGMGTPPLPWAAAPTPDCSPRTDICPHVPSEPPLTQLEAIASRPGAGSWGAEPNPPPCPLLSGSCREREGLPSASSLQPEQPQLPQPLLMGLVL